MGDGDIKRKRRIQKGEKVDINFLVKADRK